LNPIFSSLINTISKKKGTPIY